ncbi:GntR family transcriptional regulator [Natronobacillus azotifigens]|uniref:GntR family transcriptional regulator n=1 Tax=Natronobacillus azotifigens TaxID=472978 RepID=A0A9J6R8S6_9BACI|nr:GntR family transcriptional regulator [Natronobacillus azotifigens]
MFDLDLRSRDPIYQQLVDKFKELIISNILKQDEQLPSVRVLAQQLTINPNTIQKAYRELESQGYIYSVKGKGSFVDATAQVENRAALKEIEGELMKLMKEAMFLGLDKSDLKKLVDQAKEESGGGIAND